jgi:hypothetical protein
MNAIFENIYILFQELYRLLTNGSWDAMEAFVNEFRRILPPPNYANEMIIYSGTQGFITLVPYLALADSFVDMWVFFQVLIVLVGVEAVMLIIYVWKAVRGVVPFL